MPSNDGTALGTPKMHLLVSRQQGYRWWTIGAGVHEFNWRWTLGPNWWVKVGPLTLFTYPWLDGRRRWSWTWCAGDEHIVVGGHLK